MEFEPKFSVITASLGNLGDRFLPAGYKQELTLEDKLESISTIKHVTGVELCYNAASDEKDGKKVAQLLDKYKLAATAVNAPLVSDKLWRFGTFSSPDKTVRQEAEEVTRCTIDFAEDVGAGIVNLWLGQDGFDYPFQVDYSCQWENTVKGIRACAKYKPNTRLCIEFKPREPRNRALIDSASTALLLQKEIGLENVGVTVDCGHILQTGSSLAQAVEFCARQGRLFNLHLNDNYSSWDDDMIAGSVHLTEFLELLYVLRKVGYNGWCTVDIFPFREDAFRSTEESIAYMVVYNRWVERVGIEKIRSLVNDGDAVEVLRTIRTTLFA